MISFENVTKVYSDGKVALRGISLEIGQGMLGVLGPNGAGKTTFLSTLVLALEPTSGRRRYADLDPEVAAHRPRIRRMIGFLPQDFSPIRHLTGFEYLVHCARMRELPLTVHEIEARARRLLDAVALTEASRKRSGTYSGGMRRRLGIAQALIHAPKLVVVDEPTAGLDPEERIRFRNLITELADRTAVLLSTHVVEDIEATCHRVVVVAAGTILYDGEPVALIESAAGQLFVVPEGDRLPDRSIVLNTSLREGQASHLIFREDSFPEGVSHEEITLEEAYCAHLARSGNFTSAVVS